MGRKTEKGGDVFGKLDSVESSCRNMTRHNRSETATVLNKKVKILNAVRSFRQRRNLVRDIVMRVFLWMIFLRQKEN